MKNTIQKWLDNPGRDYRTGVLLFKQCADKKILQQYSDFFDSGADELHLNLLMTRLRKLQITVKNNPVPVKNIRTIKSPISKIRQNLRKKLASQVTEKLRDELEDEIRDDLRFELEDEIREELSEELKEKLPEELKSAYERIKEIRPLQASIHSSIFPENKPHIRADLRRQLLILENERRSLWDKIDSWTGGIVQPEPVVETDPLVIGAQKMKRLKQLRQNISRGKAKPAKLDAYKKELSELEKELKIN